MLRRTVTQRAAAGNTIDLPPTPLGAALLHRRVLRLLGGPLAAGGGETAARLAKVYTDIADTKTKAAALPDGKTLAIAGRAAALLSCGCLDDAAADIKTVAAAASADAGLARVAASLQARVTSAKLAHYLRTQGVQGSEAWINPAVVSSLQEQLTKDIAQLVALSPASAADFVPALLAAEAALNGASTPADAAAAFGKLTDRMFAQQPTNAKVDPNESRYAALAFDAQRAWAAERALARGGCTFKAITVGSGDGGLTNKALSAEEHSALLQVAAWREDAFAPINVLDMGDAAVAGYGPAPSAAPLLLKVGHFLGLYSAHNAVVPKLASLLESGFAVAGSHDTAPIEEALKNGKEPVLDQLASYSVGRIGIADDAFALINEQLNNGYGGDKHVDFSNLTTSPAAAALAQLEGDLLKQAHDRARVGLAASLASSNQLSKADAVLDEVLADGTYAELWRACLLKGNVAKKLGRVDASDAAFRLLHSLKQQPEGRDLPLRDAHRDISAF